MSPVKEKTSNKSAASANQQPLQVELQIFVKNNKNNKLTTHEENKNLK